MSGDTICKKSPAFLSLLDSPGPWFSNHPNLSLGRSADTMMNNECLVFMTLGQAGRLEVDIESSALFRRSVILFTIYHPLRESVDTPES